jgi:hypothetical protein
MPRWVLGRSLNPVVLTGILYSKSRSNSFAVSVTEGSPPHAGGTTDAASLAALKAITATADEVRRDELAAKKAAKKASFDAEYDVGGSRGVTTDGSAAAGMTGRRCGCSW